MKRRFAAALCIVAALAVGYGKEGRELENSWLVIAGGTAENLVPTPHAELEKGSYSRLYSRNFSNLNPGFAIIVADAFSSEEKAQEYSKSLRSRGVECYVKYSGSYQSDEIRWVESYGDRTFMRIEPDSSLLKKLPHPSNPKMISSSAWYESIPVTEVGDLSVGESFTFHSWEKSSSVEGTIKQFVWLTRGTPHFGYLQSEEKTGPGCGSPELFAELEPVEESYSFALEGKKRVVNQFDSAGVESKMALTGFIKSHPEYGKFKKQADAGAMERDGAPLKIVYFFRKYSRGNREFYAVTLTFTTGEGDTECGADDLRIPLFTLIEKKGSSYTQLLPLEENEFSLTGITDLESDGSVELFEKLSGYGTTRRIRMEKNGFLPTQEIHVDFCDCGC